MLVFLSITLLLWYTSTPTKKGIDQNLIVYLEKVQSLSQGNLKYEGLSINFTDLEKGTQGTCYFWRKEILIDRKVFKRLDFYGRILLLAHEITHCQKKIDHINGLDYWGCAAHYMHFSDSGKWCNKYKFKTYVEQMKRI